MRTIASSLATHIAGEVTKLATCWKVTLTNATVKGFTDHDTDLIVDGVTYLAASGYTASDVDTTAALNVDNLEVVGFIASPSVTEADLLAGLWDFAAVQIFQVNWSSVTDGKIWQRVGNLGEVTLQRGQFQAELRGLMEAYTTTVVELTSPTCRANLGDARCGVALGPFTVTGTVTSVGADNATIGDTGRAEAGPTGGIAVTGITQANPGVVTLASMLNLAEDSAITITGVAGMTAVNGSTLFRSPNAGKTTFQLGVDTTAYPAYTSGGTVTPLGGTSGYFDRGLITFTSGPNTGLSMEVKSYTPGQMILVLPMPYVVAVGNTYSLIAGCDKTFPTCRDRFSNVVNFRGEPYLPGLDSIVQVGRKA
jgi:hypothetical protein